MENDEQLKAAIQLDKKGKQASLFAKYSYWYNALAVIVVTLYSALSRNSIVGGFQFGVTNIFVSLLIIVFMEIILFLLYQPIIHYYRYFLAFKVGEQSKSYLRWKWILTFICALLLIPFSRLGFFIGILLLLPHFLFLFENYKMLFQKTN